MSKASERGAVAVEFAILAPVLIMLLLGIMEFGRAYNVQITLSNAAREGVRVMAINNSQSAAKAAAKNAAGVAQPGPQRRKDNLQVSNDACDYTRPHGLRSERPGHCDN